MSNHFLSRFLRVFTELQLMYVTRLERKHSWEKLIATLRNGAIPEVWWAFTRKNAPAAFVTTTALNFTLFFLTGLQVPHGWTYLPRKKLEKFSLKVEPRTYWQLQLDWAPHPLLSWSAEITWHLERREPIRRDLSIRWLEIWRVPILARLSMNRSGGLAAANHIKGEGIWGGSGCPNT